MDTTRPRDSRPPGHPDPNKLFVTSQIGETDGRFWFTVRMEKLTDSWTSPEMTLDATDWDTAREEAAVKVSRLLTILGHKLPPSATG
jgi:hypothetical protein